MSHGDFFVEFTYFNLFFIFEIVFTFAKFTQLTMYKFGMKNLFLLLSVVFLFAASTAKAVTVSGTNIVCTGLTTTFTIDTFGGTWSSATPGVATVDPATGVITGVSSGTSVISYNLPGISYTRTVTVQLQPGAISGPSQVCEGSTINLTNGTVGTWASSNVSVATVNGSGVVTGVAVAGGTTTITFRPTGLTCFTTHVVTVNPRPTTITGLVDLCVTESVTLSSTPAGGTWTSALPSTASIDPVSGLLTAVIYNSAGLSATTVTYTLPTGCSRLGVVRVNQVPSAIAGGPFTLCFGGTATLTSSTAGKTWSSTNTGVATISTGGVVSAVAAGTSTISYTNEFGCAAVAVVTVNAVFTPNTGTATVCQGLTSTLSNATAGGTWSSSTPAVGTVNSTTGVVRGIAVGTTSITYRISTSGCVSTTVVTVIATPGAITGTAVACVNANSTLTHADAGGTWSSSNTSVGTVNATTGQVTGIAAGNTTITYTLFSGCFVTRIFTVNALPSVNSITGSALVCIGSTTNLTNSTINGVWSSSATGVATVGTTGVVTGVSGGNSTISYTVTNVNGCVNRATREVTVNALPVVNAITGTTNFCQGTTSLLSSTTPNGVWSSSAVGVATVGTSGLVSGVGAGTSNISYTVTDANGCIGRVTTTVTVNAFPTVPAITGTRTLCSNTTTTLANTTSGGTWSSSDVAIATVGTGGLVTGVSNGTSTISYVVSNIAGCTTTVTAVVTVNVVPSVDVITGTLSACVGATTTLANTTGSGVWSSSNAAVGTVNSTTGVVTGIGAGTTNISYSVTNGFGCIGRSTGEVTVNPLPVVASITGTRTVCVNSTTTLANATASGVWTSSAPAIATIDAGGLVTGILAGNSTISYTVTSAFGCIGRSTAIVTVNPLPTVAAITGTASLCANGTTNLANATAGGVWASSAAGIASVGTSGVVTGVSAGNATISYTVTNGFSCSTTVTTNVTVNPVPVVAAITGTLSVCDDATTTLSNVTAGGVWSSSATGIATVGTSGIVTGVSAGNATITYRVTNGFGCITDALAAVTVNPLPVVSAITGTATVCQFLTTTLSSATSGGVWTSGATGVATVGTSGIVTGVTAGNAVISYTVTNGFSCSTTVTTNVTVNPGPVVAATSGTLSVCEAATTTLSNATADGTWSSSATGIATVGTSGIVTGVSAGNATISYIVTSMTGCIGLSIVVVTVNPLPIVAAITGTLSTCVNSTTTLSNTTGGGVWSSSSTANATISVAGVVTGVLAGNTTISYTVTDGLGCIGRSTAVVTVNSLPTVAAITGTATLCANTTTNLANATAAGVWASSATGVATVGTSGIVSGVSAGNAVISYTVTNGFGCSATVTTNVTVNPVPVVAAITGSLSVCDDATTTLSNATASGVWSSSATGVATVGTSGIVTGVSAGNATITYSVTNGFGCINNALAALTVNPLPVVAAITGTPTVCQGLTTSLSSATSGGVWSSSATGIASVGTSGIVSGVSAGNATISYTVTNGFSCSTTVTTAITVNPLPTVAAITGTASVCIGLTTTLSNATASGVWTSSVVGVATVGTSGVVSGISAGNSTISYTVTNGFGCVASATRIVTVNTNPILSSVSGFFRVCDNATVTLNSTISGGTWVSSSTANATIGSASGIVSGVSAGNTNITYTVTATGCASSIVLTVNPTPIVTGIQYLCIGNPSLLTASPTGGAWSSSNTGVATVNSSGLVTSVSVGTSNITYTGAGCFTVSQVTVNAAMPAILGNQSICETNTTLLTNAVAGGTWSSSNVTIATVGSSTGLVTGINTGVATISYTLNAGCFATIAVTVMTLPVATTGPSSVCVGLTAQLINTTGTWTSSAPGIAVVSGSGLVSGISVGNATITFYPTGSICYVTRSITVTSLPTAIAGLAPLCPGQTAALTSSPSGGTWSVQNPEVVSVNPSTGLLTAVMVHHTNILATVVYYTLPSGCAAVRVVTVNPQPAPLFGTSLFMCSGESNILTTGSSGGTWSSTNTSVATVNSSGNVTSVSAGTSTISYTNSQGCASRVVVTVNSAVSTIAGQTVICTGQTSSLTNTVAGGTWSTSNNTVASINPITGLVSGVTGGTATISYIIGSGCLSTVQVTVNSNTASIVGSSVLCVGSTTVLTYPVSGGTWSIDNPSVATINSTSGLVTGVATGAATVSYTLSSGCYQTAIINVFASPSPISGTPILCAGTTMPLTAAGGTWSSSNTSVATISESGILNGISGGNATISYTYYPSGCYTTIQATVNERPTAIVSTGICSGTTNTFTSTPTGGTWSSSNTTTLSINTATGEATAFNTSTSSPAIVTVTYTGTNTCTISALVTINPVPSAFAGGATNLCSGGGTTYVSSPSGGIWSSDNSSVATAATGGVVTAVGAGVATISYTNLYGCSRSTALTVSGVVADNTGNASVCTGQTTTLSNAISGGTWSSSNNTVASVNFFTGVVSGVTAGTVNITYRLSSTCFAVTVVTVNSSSPNILGTASACVGSTTTLTYATTGGTWSSSNAAIATIDAAGVVTGIATGVATISYFITPTCFKTRSVTIYAPPTATTGMSEVCVASSITLSNSGGTWSSSNTSLATVNSSGVVTGVNSGVVNINYRNSTSGCMVSKEVTVNTLPAVIVSSPLCPGGSITLSTTPTGGTWNSANPSVATINLSTGEVLAVATPSSASLATITYTSPSGCRRTHLVTVNPLPSAIFGNLRVCVGGTSVLNSGTTVGVWSSSNPTVASISTTRVVTGNSSGIAVISYTNLLGCSRTALVTVNPVPESISGALSVCVGSTTSLSNSTTGGTWTSSLASRASVGLTTGVVNGISAGTVNITYNLGGPISASCLSVSQVTVNATPASITGVANVCPGATTSLSHAVSGGVWSSSNTSIATVSDSTGVVTGVNTGTTIITYTLPNGCFKTVSFTVKAAPVDITGLSAVCVGSSITQFCFSGAGTWSSSNIAVASIGVTSGLLTGITEGSATITYRVLSTSCFTTRPVTIGATDAGTISGPVAMATGSTATMSKTVVGGVWSSSPATVATIGSTSGVVTALSVGSAVITYVVTSSCSSDTEYHYLDVLTPAGSLDFDGENDVVLIGSPISTGSSYTKEAWVYSNNILGKNNIISSLNSKLWLDRGIIKAGNNGVEDAVSDDTEIVPGTWVHVAVTYDAAATTMKLYKNGLLVATNTSAPAYTSEPSFLATYKDGLDLLRGSLDEVRIWNRALCQSEIQHNMNCQLALPQTGLRAYYRFNQGILAGDNTGLTALTDASGNGFVGTLLNFALTGTTSNWVAGAVSGMCAPLSSTISILYTGTDSVATVAVGSSLTLTPTVSGGTWTSSNSSIASIGAAGAIFGVNVGTAIITYSVSTPCISGMATRVVNVIGGVSRPTDVQTLSSTNDPSFVLYPNPTDGSVYFVSDVPGLVTVYSLDGKQVASYEVLSGSTSVTLPTSIARGVYTCRFVSEAGNSKIVRLIYK